MTLRGGYVLSPPPTSAPLRNTDALRGAPHGFAFAAAASLAAPFDFHTLGARPTRPVVLSEALLHPPALPLTAPHPLCEGRPRKRPAPTELRDPQLAQLTICADLFGKKTRVATRVHCHSSSVLTIRFLSPPPLSSAPRPPRTSTVPSAEIRAEGRPFAARTPCSSTPSSTEDLHAVAIPEDVTSGHVEAAASSRRCATPSPSSSSPSADPSLAPQLSNGADLRNLAPSDCHPLLEVPRDRRLCRCGDSDTKIRSPTTRWRFGGIGAATSTFFRAFLAFALLGSLLAAADDAAGAASQAPWNQPEHVELHGYVPFAAARNPAPSPRSRPTPSAPESASPGRPKVAITRNPSPSLSESAATPTRKPDEEERRRNMVITLSNDALRPFLHFTRGVQIERRGTSHDEILHEDGSFDDVFVDTERSTSVKLRCSAGPYSGREVGKYERDRAAIARSIRWLRDGAPLEGSSAELRIANASSADVGEYRCTATSREIDTFADVYPGGALVSDALFLRLSEPPRFEVHPISQAVVEGRSLRLTCRASGAPLPKLDWLRDGSPIDAAVFGGRLLILSINGESILHLLNASRSDEGRFRCVAETAYFEQRVESHSATLQIVEAAENATLDPMSLISASPETVVVTRGRSALLECLTPDSSVTVFWRIVGEKTVQKKASMIVAKVKRDAESVYECLASIESDPASTVKLRTMKLHFIERPVILNLKESPELKMAHQGSVNRFECTAFSEGPLDEVQVHWYHGGRRIVQPPRFSILPAEGVTPVKNSYGFGITFRSQLVISDIQLGDEGLYQCVTLDRAGQNTYVYALEVHSEKNDRIENLTARVDHRRNKLRLRWKLPPSVDHVKAQFIMFLLSYYSPGGGRANKIQLSEGIACTIDGYCEGDCCPPEYRLQPHENYTIQMSMMEGSRLSPLSDEIDIVSYDAYARFALDVQTLVTGDSMTVTWKEPSEATLNGVLQEYSLEFAVKPSETERRWPKPTQVMVPGNRSSFTIENLHPDGLYAVRVVPSTRAGLPPAKILREHYDWTRVPVGLNRTADRLLEVPGIGITQKNNNAIMIVNWTLSTAPDVQFVRVSYMDVTDDVDGPLREVTVPHAVGSAKLLQHLELHRKYEICAEYIKASGKHGFRACVHEYLTAGYNPFNPMADPDRRPRAVDCGASEVLCWCEPSDDKGQATRVFWKAPQDPDLDITYVVHYVIDADADTGFEDPTHETKNSFADLPDLQPNSTYQMMVEARAFGGLAVEGSWFLCRTPEFEQLPYPADMRLEAVNESTVRISWMPQTEDLDARFSAVNGYVVLLYQNNRLLEEVPVEGGRDASAVTVTSLVKDIEYQFRLSSRTDKPRSFSEKSPPLAIRLTSMPFTTPMPPWTIANRHKIVITIVLLILLCSALVVLCTLVVRIRYRKRRKVARLEARLLEEAAKNAIELRPMAPSCVESSCAPSEAPENVRLLSEEEPPSRSFDEKGDELGAQPSGRALFEKSLARGDPLLQGFVFASGVPLLAPQDVVVVHEVIEVEEVLDDGLSEVAEPEVVPLVRLLRSHSCDALPLVGNREPRRASSKSTSLHSCGVTGGLFVAPETVGIGGGDATTSTSGTSSSPHHSPSAALTSSLPNLNDSGIVYDDLVNHQSHHLSLIPSNPPPAASSTFFCHLQAHSFAHFAQNQANLTES
ncbi:hypothetical protein QR680_009347 [Steinernema hermaphroditum]|uniref:Uncharacterized protein n=1 Tax=Steinernema hermaphroditum TaxID=289476 RepID=A0AA39ILR4_9BILA|nr:hypothetical protein QR680_009347 [Steinernema hermaphroditum]